MKKVILFVLLILLFTVNIASAIEEQVSISWQQDCIDGCPVQNIGPVEEWRIYLSDTSGVYGATPAITIPYDGTPAESYSSDYVLTLSGAGTKYCIVRSYNTAGGESGNSIEASLPYNYAGSATPVNVTFTIKTPE